MWPRNLKGLYAPLMRTIAMNLPRVFSEKSREPGALVRPVQFPAQADYMRRRQQGPVSRLQISRGQWRTDC